MSDLNSEVEESLTLHLEESETLSSPHKRQRIHSVHSGSESEYVISKTPVRRSPRKRAERRKLLRILQNSDSEDKESQMPSPYSITRTNRRQETIVSPTDENNTPQTSQTYGNSSIKGNIVKILQNQRDVLAQIAVISKEIRVIQHDVQRHMDEKEQPIRVPNRVRNAVKEFFANAEDMEISWDYQKRYGDERNKEMRDFLKKSVRGVIPDVSDEVLDVAVKRYFTSKREAEIRKTNNIDSVHKQRQAKYERKKEKLRRRLLACDKKTWTKDKQTMVGDLLRSRVSYKYMSSDEEGEEGFISHPYSWESETWVQIKDSLDRKYLEICGSRSKRLLQKRTKGSIHDQEPPKLPDQFSWILTCSPQASEQVK